MFSTIAAELEVFSFLVLQGHFIDCKKILASYSFTDIINVLQYIRYASFQGSITVFSKIFIIFTRVLKISEKELGSLGRQNIMVTAKKQWQAMFGNTEQ